MKKDKTFIKVFSLILFSVFLIAFSTGYSIYKLNNEIQTVLPPSAGADDIGGQIEDQEPQNPNNPSDPQPEKPESVPLYNNAFKCIEDAYSLLDSCKGYKTTSTMTAITDILGIGSASQSVNEVAILSGDFYFKETYASCSTSLGQNFYRYFYSEDGGQNVEYKKTSSCSDNIPNWDKTIDSATVSKDEIIEKYDGVAYDIFYIRSNSSNSRLIKFDRTSDDTYYIISMLYTPSMLPEKYIENAKKEGGLSAINYTSVSITYYIEKTTLYMRKIERHEEYSITKGVTLNVKSTNSLFVNIIDQEIEAHKPSYCWLSFDKIWPRTSSCISSIDLTPLSLTQLIFM